MQRGVRIGTLKVVLSLIPVYSESNRPGRAQLVCGVQTAFRNFLYLSICNRSLGGACLLSTLKCGRKVLGWVQCWCLRFTRWLRVCVKAAYCGPLSKMCALLFTQAARSIPISENTCPHHK